MNKEEKRAIEKFRKLGIKKFREEKLTNEDLLSYFEFVIILNLIEKLQKENEELKIVKSAIQTLQINSMEDEKYIVISKSSFFDGSYKHLLDEFIPVQKVKDKIEEILKNKEYRIVFEGNAEVPDDATIINAQKYIKLEKMQELIEERKVK